MHFVTRAMPIGDIDGKSHKTEKQPKLFNQPYKIKTTPLVIYGLRGVHTHAYTHTFPHQSDFKKPGLCAPGLKMACTFGGIVAHTSSASDTSESVSVTEKIDEKIKN